MRERGVDVVCVRTRAGGGTSTYLGGDRHLVAVLYRPSRRRWGRSQKVGEGERTENARRPGWRMRFFLCSDRSRRGSLVVVSTAKTFGRLKHQFLEGGRRSDHARRPTQFSLPRFSRVGKFGALAYSLGLSAFHSPVTPPVEAQPTTPPWNSSRHKLAQHDATGTIAGASSIAR